ncbi:hypothetical protein GCM10022384_70630 [Streptomyces marokkonensis]|uniref:Uncharacterized protein n=1 Tax=Streptomyces marokkonensis TaxID=324855 RepID=A0ABP7T167_9ACTN
MVVVPLVATCIVSPESVCPPCADGRRSHSCGDYAPPLTTPLRAKPVHPVGRAGRLARCLTRAGITRHLDPRLEEFDDWICRTVLSPFSPLFREARYLLAEEADIRDTALYHSVLAAVAQGNSTRGGIAGFIGRKSVDISHPLHVLEDSHLLAREADVFRAGKSQYRITEPLINFYEAVIRPAWARLESGQTRKVWAQSAERFAAQVAGPHFETVCREYILGPGRALLRSSLGRWAVAW